MIDRFDRVVIPFKARSQLGWECRNGEWKICQELLPNGRYIEARGARERAYEGRYEVTGDHIEYWDDTGFPADGDFIDGVLHHAGMIFSGQ